MLITVSEGQKTPLHNNYLHVIDLDKTVPEIPLSEVFESITPIVLETKRSSLIRMGISRVVVTPEYLIVRDISSLFLFKRDGSFVYKFDGVSDVSDFCYDNTKGTIYALTRQMLAAQQIKWEVNLYNIHTGKLLKTIQLKVNDSFDPKIYCSNGELYAGSHNITTDKQYGQYTLNKINQKTGDVGEVWFDFEIDCFHTPPFNFSDEKSFRSIPRFVDGIVSIEKGTGKITPLLSFTPKYTLDSEDVKDISTLRSLGYGVSVRDIDWDKIKKTNKVYGIGSYFECKDLIFMGGVGVSWGETYKQILYNKKTNDFKYVSRFNDLFLKRERSPEDPRYSNNSRYAAYDENGVFEVHTLQSAYALKQLLEKDLISDSFRSTAIELSNLEESANPVLFYYKFKK